MRLKLRSDFTYRTPRLYTYVCPRGEIRKKREKERPECVFISGRVLLNVSRIRVCDRPIVTSPRYDGGHPPCASIRTAQPSPVPTHSINQKVMKISLHLPLIQNC